MSKYEPIFHHLSRLARKSVRMTFSEVEAVLGFKLPQSARKHREWSSNNTGNNVMTRQWLAASYETQQVDMGRETLVFHRREY